MDNTSTIYQTMLNSLNTTQLEAVQSEALSLKILAGPGSGKTRVLTTRVVWLIKEKGIPPSEIMVVTFTKKAANDMKKRLEDILGEDTVKRLYIGTFHQICTRLIRHYSKDIDVDPEFNIADDATSKKILNTIITEYGPELHSSLKGCKVDDYVMDEIKKAKNQGITADVYQMKAKENLEAYKSIVKSSDEKDKDMYGLKQTVNFAKIYVFYERKLSENKYLDFGSLTLKAVELLKKRSNVLSGIQAVLIDEFQDTNEVQYELIKLIINQEKNRSITIVGDPDQSIFGWRNAQPENFNKISEYLNDTKVIILEENYRSSENILSSAMKIIEQDSSRIRKNIYTANPEGVKMCLISLENNQEQAKFILEEIQRCIRDSQGLIKYRDIAILMRMTYISQDFEKVLRKNHIPYKMEGILFFDRAEIKDVISYLRFFYNPDDKDAFNRIINVPPRGLGDVTLKTIDDTCNSQNTDPLTTIKALFRERKVFRTSAIPAVNDFISISEQIQEMIREQKNIAQIITEIVKLTNYHFYLKSHYRNDHLSRWENVRELVAISEHNDDLPSFDNNEFISSQMMRDSQPDDGSLSHDPIDKFLKYCAACSNIKEQEETEEGKVTLTTLHSSKGLEWSCVFIVSCNEDIIPHKSADLKEERRLLYVAMTRSKFLLYCITTRTRIGYCEPLPNVLSRFLISMDPSLYRTTPPTWNSQTRKTLAMITNKTIPEYGCDDENDDADEDVKIKQEHSNTYVLLHDLSDTDNDGHIPKRQRLSLSAVAMKTKNDDI